MKHYLFATSYPTININPVQAPHHHAISHLVIDSVSCSGAIFDHLSCCNCFESSTTALYGQSKFLPSAEASTCRPQPFRASLLLMLCQVKS